MRTISAIIPVTLSILAASHAHPCSSLFSLASSNGNLHEQSPIMPPTLAQPGAPSSNDDNIPNTDDPSGLIISDVLPSVSSISIFASLTRSVPSISSILSTADSNATVLAPSNTVLAALPRKPWEDPRDYDALGTNAYVGEDGEGRAQKNIEKFVEAHVVRVSPWKAGEGNKLKTVGGEEVWVEEREGLRYIMPGNVGVVRVADRVANGEVWVLNGVINYDA